jgi:HMG (high mobility group) box
MPALNYTFVNLPSQEPLVPSHDHLPDFLYSPPSPDQSLRLLATSRSSTYQSPSRRSGNHVPRPRNAFMIFRNEFCAEAKISRTVEHDHRHISRIIGHCWNQLSEEEKNKWRQKAEQEKIEHIMKYPGYRFSPSARTKKVIKRKVKRNSEEELLRCKQVAELLLAGKHGVELDSAVRNMNSGTALRERKLENDNIGSSRRSLTSTPLGGELQHQSESIPFDSSAYLPALDLPVFRSPLLPPAEITKNPSPVHQTPCVSMIR